MITAWDQPGAEDCAWLMYSANYLVRTNGIRWAIDPVRLSHRLPGAPSPSYAADLASLSFVVLTHQHGDHLDIELLRALGHLPITWVVPEPLLARLRGEAGVPAAAVVVPRPLQPIDLHGIRITPFDAMHWEQEHVAGGTRPRGVPEMGYLVESGGRRWLFPGDTRTYDAAGLPALGPVDVLFAHVWLGRAGALRPDPPLLEEFCRWCIDLSPARVVLTHLDEYGRGPEDCWNLGHAALITRRLLQLRPALPVVSGVIGTSIAL